MQNYCDLDSKVEIQDDTLSFTRSLSHFSFSSTFLWTSMGLLHFTSLILFFKIVLISFQTLQYIFNHL